MNRPRTRSMWWRVALVAVVGAAVTTSTAPTSGSAAGTVPARSRAVRAVLAAGPTTSSVPGRPAAASAARPAASAVPRAKSGPLSPGLQRLADPTPVTAPPAAGSEPSAAGDSFVPAQAGPGAIMRRTDGSVVVEILVDDTGPATVAALGAAGARIVFVEESLRLFAADVQPSALRALAAVRASAPSGRRWSRSATPPARRARSQKA